MLAQEYIARKMVVADNESPLIFDKDDANERQKSLLLLSRVQLILYKDNARREQRHDGKTQSYQSGHCRAEAYLIQR